MALTSGTLTNQGGTSLIQSGGVPGSDASAFAEASELEASVFAAQLRDGGFGGGSLMDWVRRLRPFLSKAVRAAPGIVGAIAPELAPAAEAVKNLAVSLGAGHGSRCGKMKGGSILAGRRH